MVVVQRAAQFFYFSMTRGAKYRIKPLLSTIGQLVIPINHWGPGEEAFEGHVKCNKWCIPLPPQICDQQFFVHYICTYHQFSVCAHLFYSVSYSVVQILCPHFQTFFGLIAHQTAKRKSGLCFLASPNLTKIMSPQVWTICTSLKYLSQSTHFCSKTLFRYGLRRRHAKSLTHTDGSLF